MNSKEHKNHVSGVFTRMASTYDQVGFRFFSHFGKRLVELIGIPEKAKVLDIATGRGASLFPTSKKIGTEGFVVGIDLAEGMVRETGKEIRKRGTSNTKVVQMDAESLTYQNDTFDIVLCGLSIFFFPQYETALSEALRVLRPEGQIGITTFYQKSHNELQWVVPLIQKYISPKKEERKSEKNIGDPGFDTTEGMQKMLVKAGFRDVYHEIEEKQFTCRDAEELWEFLWSIYTRNALEQISPTDLTELEKEVKRNYIKYSHDNAFYITVRVLFTFGKK